MKATTFAVALTGLTMLAGAASAQGYTEPQARAVFSDACNNVSNLSRDRAGNWHGSCSKGSMMLGADGKVVKDTGGMKGELTEGQARYAMSDACNNVSNLSQDSQGNWHGSCSKGNMMVGADGKAVADKGGMANGLTEGNARAIASDACNNVSNLYTDSQGNWVGGCSKGMFKINPSGKIAFN